MRQPQAYTKAQQPQIIRGIERVPATVPNLSLSGKAGEHQAARAQAL